MSALFGTLTVHVATIEWGDLDDIHVIVDADPEALRSAARKHVIDTFAATVPEYDPDGCRAFVLDPTAVTENGTLVSELHDQAWLNELHEATTVPWVTITEHTIPIQ